MKNLLLGILLLSSIATYATPVEQLVNIPYPIRYHKSIGMNAVSDGFNIIIGTELRDFINDEDQLGLVILHEAHHNSLEHGKQRLKEVYEMCGQYTTKESARVCVDLYKSISFAKQQQREREADMGSFLVGKKIGYTSEVCKIFNKFKDVLGEVPDYAEHPKFKERYDTCIRVFTEE
jgi:hypothetical protein